MASKTGMYISAEQAAALHNLLKGLSNVENVIEAAPKPNLAVLTSPSSIKDDDDEPPTEEDLYPIDEVSTAVQLYNDEVEPQRSLICRPTKQVLGRRAVVVKCTCNTPEVVLCGGRCHERKQAPRKPAPPRKQVRVIIKRD
jgi:hypothetical protein